MSLLEDFQKLYPTGRIAITPALSVLSENEQDAILSEIDLTRQSFGVFRHSGELYFWSVDILVECARKVLTVGHIRDY